MKLLLILITFFSLKLYSQETIETSNFNQNYEIINQLLEQYAPDEILVALDIDNNLLAHDHDLGSDQWFRWQMGLLGTKSPYKVANSFEELIRWYSLSINIHGASTHLTDPSIYPVLQKLKIYGVPHMALTARGRETLAGTRRELARNQIKYSFKAPRFEVDTKIQEFDRPVYYKDGLAMIAGQDKGEFIKYALNQTENDYKVIVMIDDQLNNVEKVHAAFENSSIKTIGLRFSAEDKNVSRFLRSTKKSVHQAFLKLKTQCDLSYL